MKTQTGFAEKASVQGKHSLEYKLDPQTLKYRLYPQKGRHAASYKVDTKTDDAEKLLNKFLRHNKDKIMKAFDGDEAVFDAVSSDAYSALRDILDNGKDNIDIDRVLKSIFRLDIDEDPETDPETDPDDYLYPTDVTSEFYDKDFIEFMDKQRGNTDLSNIAKAIIQNDLGRSFDKKYPDGTGIELREPEDS